MPAGSTMRLFQGPRGCFPGAGHSLTPHEQRPAVTLCIGTTDHPCATASRAARACGVNA